MGNTDSNPLRICGAGKKRTLSEGENKDVNFMSIFLTIVQEDEPVIIEENKDHYFDKEDMNKILEKYPEYHTWMEKSLSHSLKEKLKHKKMR